MLPLNRFVAQRGKLNTIFSDNATNFQGAYNKDICMFFLTEDNLDAIQDHILSSQIEWKFIPPANPHWEGLREDGTKYTKYFGNAFEQVATILIQIESTLNSQPLCPMLSDPLDFTPLTLARLLLQIEMCCRVYLIGFVFGKCVIKLNNPFGNDFQLSMYSINNINRKGLSPSKKM